MQKILLDEMGLNYICATAERFFAVRRVLPWLLGGSCLDPSRMRAPPQPRRCRPQTDRLGFLDSTKQVSTVLSNMVQTLIEVPSVRLLKHIVRCYLRLSENPRCVLPPEMLPPPTHPSIHRSFGLRRLVPSYLPPNPPPSTIPQHHQRPRRAPAVPPRRPALRRDLRAVAQGRRDHQPLARQPPLQPQRDVNLTARLREGGGVYIHTLGGVWWGWGRLGFDRGASRARGKSTKNPF